MAHVTDYELCGASWQIWFTTGDEFRGAPILDREVVKIARNGHAELLMVS